MGEPSASDFVKALRDLTTEMKETRAEMKRLREEFAKLHAAAPKPEPKTSTDGVVDLVGELAKTFFSEPKKRKRGGE
jgi:hypothetical protein